jgi:hypothetical protein
MCQGNIMPAVPDSSKNEGLVRSHELFEELQSDVFKAYELLNDDRSSQFLRRTVVRTIFSLIEGMAEIIKVELRSTLRVEGGSETLSDKELKILGGLSFVPRPEKQKFLPLEDNLKATFKLAAKIWRIDGLRLDCKGEGYRDFLIAKDARNCLTHPRKYYDIQVTDQNMHCHTVAFEWSNGEFRRIFENRGEKLVEGLPPEDREIILGQIKCVTNGA